MFLSLFIAIISQHVSAEPSLDETDTQTLLNEPHFDTTDHQIVLDEPHLNATSTHTVQLIQEQKQND